MTWIIRAAALGLATAWLASAPATAQAPASTRLRGAIESVDGSTIVFKSREGETVTAELAGTARLVAVAKAQLSDIKPGSYVGVAALPQPDGSLMAIEVLIFPEAMRGAGEGHRPWDLMPESTMTNATVAETVSQVAGPVLTLTYKDGQKRVSVPPEAPIVTFIPADKGDLKPGAKVMATVSPGTGRTMTASSIVVGKNGVDPPM